MSGNHLVNRVDATQLESLLGEDFVTLIEMLGTRVVTVRALSRFRAVDSPRMAFRLDLADGRRVKLRRIRREGKSLRIEQILAAASADDFGRVLHRSDHLLVEEWVEGRELEQVGVDGERLEAAGALLGRLHSIEQVAGRPVREVRPTTDPKRTLQETLTRLCRAGTLDAARARDVFDAASRLDPMEAEYGVTHGDFCAENIVVDATGRLRAIDNSDLDIRPLDGDLARSAQRWPLAPTERDAFLGGYARFRDPSGAERDSGFWALCALASSARVRLLANDHETCAQRVGEMLRIVQADLAR